MNLIANQNQTVLLANTAKNGFFLQNTGLAPVWVDSGRPAVNDGSSVLLAPGDAIDSTVPGFALTADLNVYAPHPGGTVALKYS